MEGEKVSLLEKDRHLKGVSNHPAGTWLYSVPPINLSEYATLSLSLSSSGFNSSLGLFALTDCWLVGWMVGVLLLECLEGGRRGLRLRSVLEAGANFTASRRPRGQCSNTPKPSSLFLPSFLHSPHKGILMVTSIYSR